MIITSLKYFSCLVLTLFVFCSAIICPQPLPSKIIFNKLTIENGLSSSGIYAIHQDKTGFMWFGTENGLNRYDGYNFKIFKHNRDDINSIADDYTWDICEDKDGNLWFATNSGLDKYNPLTGKFTHFVNNPNDSNSVSSNLISSIAIDAENNLWVGTWDAGFNIYSSSTNKFKRFQSGNFIIQSELVWYIFKDSKNNMWVGTEGGGLLRYNYTEKKYSIFLERKIITSICEDSEGDIWFGTYGDGLIQYDYVTNNFTDFKSGTSNTNSIADDYIWKVYTDSKGLLWIAGTAKGLTQYDKSQNKFTRLAHNPYNPQSMSSNLVLDIYEDRANNLWIGTVDKGINKTDRKPKKFHHLKSELNNPNSLRGDFILSLCEDRSGNIWISNYNEGVTKYNHRESKFSFYENNPSDSRSLSNNQPRIIYEDKSGTIWIGNIGGGINKYNPRSNSFERYNVADGLSNSNVRIFFEDNENNFWIGTSGGGLNKFDRLTNRFTHFINDPANDNSLSSNTVTSICQDKHGILWIGTFDGGLNRFDPKTNTFKRYFYPGADSANISGNTVTYLYYSKEGNLWIGTWNSGVSLYNETNDRFIQFTEKDGLLNNVICGIGEDNNGDLWISSVKGISKFNYTKREFQNYSMNDGIQKGELNPGAFLINKEGWIFLGGTDGVSVFHPDSLKRNTMHSGVVMTSLKILNEEYLTETQIPFLRQLELNHDEDIISIEFASLDFTNPSRNRFAYMLEGFDNDWIESGTRNFITYTNLDAGNYTFKVKGTNSDGVWNDIPADIKILINAPWWQTSWAYAGYIIIIISGLWGIRRFEKSRIKLRNELRLQEFESQKLKEIETMKSRFFANLSHEFRTPLMLIKGPAEQLLNNHPDSNSREQLKMITRNTENLKNLIDQLLELSQLEAASIPLKAKKGNLISLLRGLTLSFESLAKEKSILLKFESAEDSLIAWVDRDKLEKIMNNLLSNAFKFTKEGGTVSVTVERKTDAKNETALIIISDTGIGIPKNKLEKIFDRFYQADDLTRKNFGGSGIGLALVKELVELHKWNISVTSKENVGTEFQLIIPVVGYLHKNVNSDDNLATENTSIDKKILSSSESLEEKNEVTNLSAEKSSILIVDDSDDVRIYLSGLLNSDYNITEARNGREGINLASEKSPDLIISDIMMPEMDGIEFCKKIKTDFQTSHIPLILLTARVSDKSKYEGLETGADDYLTKPFDSKELLIRVKNLLEQRKRLKEKFGKDLNVNPSLITQNPVDKEFLEKTFSIAEKNLDNPDFDAESFAKELFMSLSQLRRKLKAVTGQAPGELLRTYKLKRAAQMILEKRLSITQISLEVGFNSSSHFTKAFREQFNCLPSDFKG